ncbi:hypothetical protein BDM02DRAFT_3190826 [Thelephora ganbajun]|uniref:Uncharacterized protein n=1 Tax=Thelephora ganbajun TaxID=370292 RepID=A0ACB6Z3U3_THEGA|nr:hypothetical protein BDM02DRAFT_3190826 [Thelephora ganbajun]
MSSQLDLLIAVGHDLTAIKYYALATCTILFYDHLLTLADEIKYVWSGRKSWMFFLFVANRYFPMMYQFWLLAFRIFQRRCDKTAFLSIFTFVVCTLIAQVVLTVRIYAVTRKSIPIATGFAVITASQLALGLYLVTFAAKRKGQALPPIPFDAYRLCIFIRHRTLEIAYTSVSLLYDFLAFSLIIFLATKSRVAKLKIPGILGTIAEDATRYFLVIFTSHFVLEMTLTLGRESIQLLPASQSRINSGSFSQNPTWDPSEETTKGNGFGPVAVLGLPLRLLGLSEPLTSQRHDMRCLATFAPPVPVVGGGAGATVVWGIDSIRMEPMIPLELGSSDVPPPIDVGHVPEFSRRTSKSVTQ